MTTSFWEKLKKPFFVLAPMADVTDVVFREMIVKYSRHGQAGGGPDVLWTEFVAADGLAHPVAREKLLVDLQFNDSERPIVAQLFGSDPDNMREAAKWCRELGFDGIDINMGCPEKSICMKQGAGCGMIRNPENALAIIQAAQEGAGGIPVSVKTRIGFTKNEIDTWVPTLLSANIPLLTMHLRTRSEMSDVPARWDLMKNIVSLRDKLAPDTLIFGNGDVLDLKDARKKIKETGCDGVMFGRAIFGNPWLFDEEKTKITVKEKLDVMMEHTARYEEVLGKHKNFNIMKKHYKAYVNGFPKAKELRIQLMEADTADEVKKLTRAFMDAHPDVLSKATERHFDPKYA